MGEVYLAWDQSLERNIALKVLPPEFVANAERLHRFVKEAKAASAVSHPNVAHIYEIAEADTVHFIAMEYIEGETLASRIKKGLSVEEIIRILKQIAEALDRAHSKGITHRDIKPSNIMITQGEQVKLLDFGLAKRDKIDLGDSNFPTMSQTELGTTLGTLPYMSPEQLMGKGIDHRTDFFSLGSVLYEMIAGRFPFIGNTQAEIADKILHSEPDYDFEKKIPGPLETILRKLLAKKPEGRYSRGAEIVSDLETIQTSKRAAVAGGLFQRAVLIPLGLILIAATASFLWWQNRTEKMRWAREVALPQISRLISEDKHHEAEALASQAAKYIPDDPTLKEKWAAITEQIDLISEPPGADVYRKLYEAKDEGAWQYVGKTPLQKIKLAKGWYRWKFQKAGYKDAFRMSSDWFRPRMGNLSVALEKADAAVPGMVKIPGGIYQPEIFGIQHQEQVKLDDYWMDEYEVSNEAFKRFVDQGGYQKQEYWKVPFIKDGKTLEWKEAMAFFVDRSGRPGPREWELGDYPEGRGKYPVTGVSWYEAAAYARFVGKELPSVYHWYYAAGTPAAAKIIPLSNYSNAGLQQTGGSSSMSRFGNFDMAGNVREWCWNELKEGTRYAMGGAWGEPSYLFYQVKTRPAFDRSEKNGFRCVRYTKTSAPPELFARIEPTLRELQKPVSDEIFEVYKNLYAYDPAELNSRIESGSESKDWKKEKISFDGAYGNERVIAWIYLPKNGKPPYQTVIYFPPAPAQRFASSDLLNVQEYQSTFDFIIKSGRAFVHPVYKGMLDRGGSPQNEFVIPSPRQRRDGMIQRFQDLARTIDYVETRRDLDSDKLAYYGVSWGANTGTVYLAIEKRIKIGIFAFGELGYLKPLPEVDKINFLPRIKQPILMINGRYDDTSPIETSQKVIYRMLGTPEKDKSHLIFEGGHAIARVNLVRPILDWLDRYFGPVS